MTSAGRILGVDPGLEISGYAVLTPDADGEAELLEAGVVRGGSSRLPLPERLLKLHQGFHELMLEVKPSALALEDLYSHVEHPRTAVLMGHARGAICLAAAQAGVPVFAYPATTVKLSVCGNGHAGKAQVQRAVQAILGLEEVPGPADVADAMALALCHWHRASVRLGMNTA